MKIINVNYRRVYIFNSKIINFIPYWLKMITLQQSFDCPICIDFLSEPYECTECHNNFCKNCYATLINNGKMKNIEICCPLCKTIPFICKSNYVFNEILKKQIVECKKCKMKFNSEDYEKHKKNCKKVKCYFCKEEFIQIEVFLNHISHSKNHKLSIIKLMNNIKPCNLNQAYFFYEKEENRPILSSEHQLINSIKKRHKNERITSTRINYDEDSINSDKELSNSLITNSQLSNNNLEKYYFKNLIAFINDKINDSYNKLTNYNYDIITSLPSEYKYFKECDLIYCGKDNNLNCKCCEDHICKPGNCFCRDCMKLNKEYHCLKPHYLINKEGRAARYENKTFQCYATFEKTKKRGKNNFRTEVTCISNSPCNECKYLTELMNKYLNFEIVNNLKFNY